MNILDTVKNLILLFPLLIYYFIEALFLGLFIQVIWRFFLSELFNLYIGYFQWVCIIWIVKVIFFDIFKIIASFNNITTIMKSNGETNLNQDEIR